MPSNQTDTRAGTPEDEEGNLAAWPLRRAADSSQELGLVLDPGPKDHIMAFGTWFLDNEVSGPFGYSIAWYRV